MTQAQTGQTVRVHYTGKFDDGSVFDSSQGRDPLEFPLGAGQVIPGFEDAIVGMSIGDKKTVNIPCDNAYGPHHPEMIDEVERSAIPAEIDLQVGGQLQAMGPDNQPVLLTIVALSDSHATMDANHPLAGKDLTFELELVEIV